MFGNMVSFDMCEGNPGALTFMIQAYDQSPFKAERAFKKMDDHEIRGSKLYLFWNDCCDRNTALAVELMIKWPIDVIVHHINYEEGRGISVLGEDGEVLKYETANL